MRPQVHSKTFVRPVVALIGAFVLLALPAAAQAAVPGVPSIIAPAQPSPTNDKTTAAFAFQDSGLGDPATGFKCAIDDATVGLATTCTSPKSYTGLNLTDGVHYFYVWATNGDGDSASPASVAWTVDTNAPTLTVTRTAPASTPTTSTAATITYSASDAGSGLASTQCKLDSGSYAACAVSPVSLSGLTEGAHTYYVKATDNAGNVDTKSVSWTVDNTPPTTPNLTGSTPFANALAGNYTNSTTASIAFVSTDAVGPITYECSYNGGAYAACTSPYTKSALTDGGYTVSVVAVDAVGNRSGIATAAWMVDTVAPTTPAPALQYTGTTNHNTQTVTWPAVTDASPVTYTCSLDAGAYASCLSPKDLSSLADGPHTYFVKATDAAGNSTTSTPALTWTVDTTPPPAVTLSGAPAAVTNVTSQNISWAAVTDTYAGPVTYTCSVDGGAYAACTSPQARTGLADGPHSLAVKSVDSLGNTSAATTASWTVDTVAPAAPVVSGLPTGSTYVTGATVTFTGDSGVTFLCRLDGASYSACTSPQTLTGLALGGHQYSVKAVDAAGNISEPTTNTWTIVTPPPACAKPNVVASKLTYYRANGRWFFNLGSTFASADDTRGCDQLMTVQVSEKTTKPSDSQAIPTVPRYTDGIIAWAANNSRASRLVPRWVRVGTRAGKWTNWVATQRVAAPKP